MYGFIAYTLMGYIYFRLYGLPALTLYCVLPYVPAYGSAIYLDFYGWISAL